MQESWLLVLVVMELQRYQELQSPCHLDTTVAMSLSRVALIYHLTKQSTLRRAITVVGGLGSALLQLSRTSAN